MSQNLSWNTDLCPKISYLPAFICRVSESKISKFAYNTCNISTNKSLVRGWVVNVVTSWLLKEIRTVKQVHFLVFDYVQNSPFGLM